MQATKKNNFFEKLLTVSSNRKKTFYKLLSQTTEVKLRNYLQKAISDNHLFCQNLHFTHVEESGNLFNTFKTLHKNEGIKSNSLNFEVELKDCIASEKLALVILQDALRVELPLLTRLIVLHEIKRIEESICELSFYKMVIHQ